MKIQCIAAVLAAATAISNVEGSYGRALFAVETADGCQWKNNACYVNPLIALSFTSDDENSRLLQKFSALAYLCSQKTEAACKNDCSWRADIAKCDIGIELYHPDLLFCPWGKGAGQLVCEVAENNEDCEDLSDCQWLEPSSTDLSQIAQLEPIIQAAMGAPASSKSSFGNASPQTSQQPNLGSVQRSDNGDVLPTEPTCLPKRVTYLEYVNSIVKMYTTSPGRVTYSGDYWGTCAGTALIDLVVNACVHERNESSCKADKLCKWSPENTPWSPCSPISDEVSLFLEVASGGIILPTLRACSAAVNETQCTAAATRKRFTFDDSKAVQMAAYVPVMNSPAPVINTTVVDTGKITGNQTQDTTKNNGVRVEAAAYNLVLACMAALLLLLL